MQLKWARNGRPGGAGYLPRRCGTAGLPTGSGARPARALRFYPRLCRARPAAQGRPCAPGLPRARRCARQGYYTTKRGAHPPLAGATPRVWAGAVGCHPRAIPSMTCPVAASGSAAYSSPEIAASGNAPAPFPGMYPITPSFGMISPTGRCRICSAPVSPQDTPITYAGGRGQAPFRRNRRARLRKRQRPGKASALPSHMNLSGNPKPGSRRSAQRPSRPR